MKIRANYRGEIVLEEVYSGVGLETSDGETMGICMRDSGFEFNYNGTWYSAKKGVVEKMDDGSTKAKELDFAPDSVGDPAVQNNKQS